MKIYQSRSFDQKIKKIGKQGKMIVDQQILEIIERTTVGIEKKGDLRGIHVCKFKVNNLKYLLSYRFVGEDLELIMIGPHENFYRDLKNYLKS